MRSNDFPPVGLDILSPNYAPLSCSLDALRSVDRFARGVVSNVAIGGPSGWGRSHLLRVASAAIWLYQCERVQVHDARSWIESSREPLTSKPVLLDDVHDALATPRTRHHLLSVLRRRSELQRATLISFHANPEMQSLRGLFATSSWYYTTIREPGIEDRERMVAQFARKRSARISPFGMRLIALMVGGSAHSIEGAIRRLKLVTADWSDPAKILELSGLLLPYREEGSSIDPREVIHDEVGSALIGLGFKSRDRKAIIATVMFDHAHITEHEIADTLMVRPGDVYTMVQSIRSRKDDKMLDSAMNVAVIRSIQALCHV